MTVSGPAFGILLVGHLPEPDRDALTVCPVHAAYRRLMVDAYLPLLSMLDRWEEEQVPGRIALALSPAVTALLADERLIGEVEDALQQRIHTSEASADAAALGSAKHQLAEWDAARWQRLLSDYSLRWKGRVMGALIEHHHGGRLQLLASTGSHTVLPLLGTDQVSEVQIAAGVEAFADVVGEKPEGLWLPECAYREGIDAHLAKHRVRFTIVSASSLRLADGGPGHSLCPVASPSGVAFFAPDPAVDQEIWGHRNGAAVRFSQRHPASTLPLHTDTRDRPRAWFDVDRADDSPLSSLDRGGANGFAIYDPNAAHIQLREDAARFVNARIQALSGALPGMSLRPYCLWVTPVCELAWWSEGLAFVDSVARLAAHAKLQIDTPSAFLAHNEVLPCARPATASWAADGYFERWVGEDNAWLYRYLGNLTSRLQRVFGTHHARRGAQPSNGAQADLEVRALSQAARELLLAHSSDWSAMIGRGVAPEYALGRITDHITTAHSLADMVETQHIDLELLRKREAGSASLAAVDFQLLARGFGVERGT